MQTCFFSATYYNMIRTRDKAFFLIIKKAVSNYGKNILRKEVLLWGIWARL